MTKNKESTLYLDLAQTSFSDPKKTIIRNGYHIEFRYHETVYIEVNTILFNKKLFHYVSFPIGFILTITLNLT